MLFYQMDSQSDVDLDTFGLSIRKMNKHHYMVHPYQIRNFRFIKTYPQMDEKICSIYDMLTMQTDRQRSLAVYRKS